MALEDLDFKISADLGNSIASLKALDIGSQLATSSLGKIQTGFNSIAQSADRLTTAQTAVKDLSHSVAGLQFNLAAASTGMTMASVAAKPLVMLSGKLGFLSTTFRLAATGAAYLAGAAGLVVGVLDYLFAGIGLLLAPLAGLAVVVKLIIASFRMMFSVIIAPFKILIGVVGTLFKVMAAVLQPVLAVAAAFFRLQLMVHVLKLQFVLMSKFLAFLPPQLRMIFVGLVALGAAGKAGAFALKIVGAAARLAAVAFRGVQIVSTALLSPLAAARMLVASLARGFLGLSAAAGRAAMSMARFAVTQAVAGMRSLGSAVGSVAGMIGGKLIGFVKAGATALLYMGVAAAAWGVKTAMAAEKSAVVFGTMLKSMSQGKALMRELEKWEGAKLFDPKAVQDAGRDLFKAGIPVTQLIGRLDQLGNIATATSTPIEELSRIYRQGMAKGAFQTDLVNQMAERGIDIYHALEKVTGKSGQALAKMMQDGEIGAATMNAAIEHMTTGTGIYAGAVANVAQTTGGMWSAMTQKMSIAVRSLGENIIAAFGFNKLFADGAAFFDSLKGQMQSAMPAFMAVAGVVQAAFGAVWEVVSVIFNAITTALGITGGNWMQSFVEWAAIAAWSFQQWPTIAELTFTNIGLSLVRFGAMFIHSMTVSFPAYLAWFFENWKSVFFKAFDVVATVFINIGTNIRASMTAIWDYIKSGGIASLSMAWAPLLDGFRSTLAELPNIPDRAIGQLEANLAAQSVNLGAAVSGGLEAAITGNLQMLQDYQTQQANITQPALVDQTGGTSLATDAGDATKKASQKATENKAVFARSSEGQSVVAQMALVMGKGDREKKAQNAAIEQGKDIKRLVREVERGKPLAARAWA
jgi:tape measure domain-containing protein